MKIALILTTDFPTQRAYGVTTFHTADALKRCGHTVEVYSTTSERSRRRFGLFNFLQPLMRRGFGLPSPLGTSLHFASRSLMVRSLLNSGELWDFDLLWVRDAYLAAALRKRLASKPLCVEVHQAPTRRQTRYFQSADSAETFWGPISELTEKSIRQLICADPERVGRLPMAASEDFFTTGARDCANSSARQTQRIGYFGSFRSGGKDQKVGALAEVVMSMHTQVPVELYLVGIGYEGRRRIEQLVNDQERSNQIKVIEHVEHKRIPNLMHSCDVLVLPYPGEAEFFESRFPIKLVEYAASNRPIVISDTPGHRAIFPENAGYFFTWEAKSSLVDALLRALSDDNEVAERVRIARKWSENLRYENRVEPVLTWLDQRRSQ